MRLWPSNYGTLPQQATAVRPGAATSVQPSGATPRRQAHATGRAGERHSWSRSRARTHSAGSQQNPVRPSTCAVGRHPGRGAGPPSARYARGRASPSQLNAAPYGRPSPPHGRHSLCTMVQLSERGRFFASSRGQAPSPASIDTGARPASSRAPVAVPRPPSAGGDSMSIATVPQDATTSVATDPHRQIMRVAPGPLI